jgi:phosphatidylglycerol---prolipoprotein diacylglyceryl transferase
MLPFIRVADIPGPIPIHTFGLLVAIAVMYGTSLTLKRARQRGLDVDLLNSGITWMLILGFLVAHWFNDIFYEWKHVVEDPLRLLRIWESISSFGGFLGAFIGIMLWKYVRAIPMFTLIPGLITIHRYELRKEPLPVFAFCDLILSVFPVAWIFGRLGCTTAHDHIGAVAEKGVAIAVGAPSANFRELMQVYKGPPWFALVWGEYPRYDLGLLELLFTIGLSAFIILSWKKKLPTGTYIAVASLAYAPVRYVMDAFRLEENDVRHYGQTPAQWMCIVVLFAGIWAAYKAYENSKKDVDPLDFFRLRADGSQI